MNMQEIVIKRYQELFPREPLRETAAKTGIQITRVFRIFNGSEMKLKEYESFEKIIQDTRPQTVNNEAFLKVTRDCLLHLSENKISEYIHDMNMALKIKSLSKKKPFSKLHSNQLA
jgi:hypothetical protein